MQLDWITVVAQIVNFLIIVWLLKRFLYGPISRAMERREAEIRGRLDEARQQWEKAEARERELAREREAFEAGREERLAAIREEVDDLSHTLRAEVRAEVEEKRAAWLAELREERSEFLAEMRGSVAREFRALAEVALGSLVDMRLEARMVDVLIDRLGSLDAAELARLREGARREGGVEVVGGEPLKESLQRRLAQAIRLALGDHLEVRFGARVPDLVGIRLKGGSMTLEWSLDEFLDRFVDDLSERFPERVAAGETAQRATGLARGAREGR